MILWFAFKCFNNDCIELVTGDYFWIGLTDQETEGVWLWSHSLSAPQNSQWKSGAPDGGTTENCVMLLNGSLDDFSCDHVIYFICEKQ